MEKEDLTLDSLISIITDFFNNEVKSKADELYGLKEELNQEKGKNLSLVSDIEKLKKDIDDKDKAIKRLEEERITLLQQILKG